MALDRDAKDYSAENLRRLRASSGNSRKDMIEYLSTFGLEMHETTLRRIENGVQPMKAAEIIAVCKTFGMDVEEFLTKPVNPEEAYLSDLLAKVTASRDEADRWLGNFANQVKKVSRMVEDGSIPPSTKSQAARELRDFKDQYQDLLPVVYMTMLGLQTGAENYFNSQAEYENGEG